MTHTRLRGRAAEQAVLRRAGRGVVVVGGEPGIGRTALLRAEVAHASGDGYASYAAARPDDAIAPLATLAPALRPLMSADAFHSLADLQDKPLWLAERLASVLAAKAPALIAVDDVRWADPLSAFLLRTLPARLAGAPVRWLIGGSGPAVTPAGGGGATSASPGDGAVRRLDLGPLSPDTLIEIAADRLGHRPDAALRTRLAGLGGLPYLAVRVIGDDEAGLRTDVRRRLAGSSDRCRALVSAASVLLAGEQPTGLVAPLGAAIRLDDVALLLGEQPVDLIGPLGEAIALGLLADGDDGVSFRHEMLRRAVHDDLTPSARRTLRDSGLDLCGPELSTMDEELNRLLDAEAPRPDDAWAALTAMEQRVATLISNGHTNRSAATALHLSPSTVSTHLRAVFAKLGINSRVQLTRLAMRRQPT
ncbi:LuxR C-terminal-related transcriptional regulator [Actinoplanes sp. NPDC049265]|uniref:LuxR C-terminal-related transcriptional regulator n=1 Tax=Actinoplanes sp. NPDC049265 TaxID=3363902 RepID=UPI003714E67E